MIASMSSRELAEWIAYERATGPLGPQWRDEAAAALHEQLQVLCAISAEDYDRNPYPRPHETYIPEDDDEIDVYIGGEDEDDDDD